jgi:hypothetical protein
MRMRARRAATRLDVRLAERAEIAGDSLLALRAAQLTSRRTRQRLARALERCTTRHWALSAAVPVDPHAIGAARPAVAQLALAQLAAALRSPEPVEPSGMARVRLLLTDPASPLYVPANPNALYEAARHALLALPEDAGG